MHIVDKIPFIFFIAMMGPILQIIYNPQLLLLLVLSPNTIKAFFSISPYFCGFIIFLIFSI